jgi:type I restriction enzyme S subunit
MELKRIHIGDIGRIVTGKTPRTSVAENYGGDIPFLTPSDDLTNKYAPKTAKTLTSKGLSEVKNCLLPKNTICVSCIGSDLGKVVLTEEETVTNQQFNSIVPSDDFDTDFVYYLMMVVGHQLNFLSKTSTAVPIINKSFFSAFEVLVPAKEDQKRVAAVLSSIDNKIALNNRINHNLEEQAKALYKSWFVDFEPFKDGMFIDSEMGLIPEGWRVGKMSELLEVRYGKDHLALKDGTTPVYGSGGFMRYAERALYVGESVLIPRKGTLNNVMYVNSAFWTVDTMFYTVERASNAIKYCHLFLRTQDLASMNAGSAVPSMTTDILNNLLLLIPPYHVLDAFNRIVSSIYKARSQSEKESNYLSKSRDTILPQLMSGALIN